MGRFKRINSKGFTLVEVMVVIIVLGIVAGIAVLSVTGTIEKSRKDVCDVNVLQMKRMYETYLDLESMEHSDVVFNQYFQEYREEICPLDGDIRYVDGKVHCSVHSEQHEDENDDENGGSVPFL
jgi:prepilin-type N-terminal cleavage/methylation domain-containing protein